jgi:hypothetical protein
MCLRDAPQPVQSVFARLLDAHGGLLATDEIATAIDQPTLVRFATRSVSSYAPDSHIRSTGSTSHPAPLSKARRC